MKHIKVQAGFSFVELILVIGIFATLVGLATISLVNVQHQSSLSATVNAFIADLKSQQMKAMMGDTEGSGNVSDYGVRFGTTSYTLFRGIYGTTNFIITLPSTIHVSESFVNTDDIIFQTGSGEIAGLTGFGTITFSDTSDGSQKVITINKYGVITNIN